MSDQVGGNVSGLLYLRRHSQIWNDAILSYLTHPVMLSGVAVIFIILIGLAVARVLDLSPSTQIFTARALIPDLPSPTVSQLD